MLLKKDITADRVADLLGGLDGAFLIKASFSDGTKSAKDTEAYEAFMETCFSEFAGTSIIKTKDGYLILGDQQLTRSDGTTVSATQLVDHLKRQVRQSDVSSLFKVDGIKLEKLGGEESPAPQSANDIGPCPDDFYDQIWWHRRRLSEMTIASEPIISLRNRSTNEIRCQYPEPSRQPKRGAQLRDRYFELATKPIGYDVHLLGEAVNMALDYSDEAPDLIIRSGINFEGFINRRSREIYLNELRQIPQMLRDNIAIELVRIPDGTPAARISDVLSKISSFVRKTCITVSPDWVGQNLSNVVGVDEVCFVLPPFSEKGHERATLRGRLRKLSTQCAQSRIDLTIANITAPEMIELADDVDATSVSGPLLTTFFSSDQPFHKQSGAKALNFAQQTEVA